MNAHGKKKKHALILTDSERSTVPLDAYSQYPRPRPERHIYRVPFDHDAVVLASAFVLSVAQACISLIDNVSCLFEANLNDYAGEFSEGGTTQKNFTGIETPWTIKEAMEGPQREQWGPALLKEVTNLCARGTWQRANPFEYKGKPVIRSKVAFKVKMGSEGEITGWKCRHVAFGNTQCEGDGQGGGNYDDIFAPVVRSSTFRLFCADACRQGCIINQCDFCQAYIQAHLDDGSDIFMMMPNDFYKYAEFVGLTEEMIGRPGDVFRINRSLYGLKQAGNLWSRLLRSDLEDLGFKQSKADECLYTLDDPKSDFWGRIITYVDDVLYYSNKPDQMDKLMKSLTDSKGKNRDIEFMGEAKWFTGIKITQDTDKGQLSLTQSTYIKTLLKNNALGVDLTDAHAAEAPCSTNKEITKESSPDLSTLSPAQRDRQRAYRSCLGAILFVNNSTRPDITFATNRLGRFASNPGEEHFKEMKHLLRYLKGTSELGLTYHKDHQPDFYIQSNSIKVGEHFDLLRPIGFSDSDWATDQTTRRSCSGWCVLWMGAAVVFGCGVQQCVALSTTEAEIIALSRATQEVVAVRKVMVDLEGKRKDRHPTFIFCDNKGSVDLVKNNRYHKRTKHIDLRYFYCRDKEEDGTTRAARVPTALNIADGFTKAIDKNTVLRHRFNLHGMK
jgi:hypothetical protein